jgi:hypothetical protein
MKRSGFVWVRGRKFTSRREHRADKN